MRNTTITPNINDLKSNIESLVQIKPYISPNLLPLHNSVMEFYEATKITSKYEQLLSLLGEIKKQLDLVECKESYYTVTEKGYLTLLKQSFMGMLTKDVSDAYIVKIIRWCINQDLLQQAVTMTAERLPRYMLYSSVINNVDEQVIKDCEKMRQPWDNWVSHLFKNYNPYGNSKKTDLNKSVFTEKAFKNLIIDNKHDYIAINKAVKGINQKIDKFLDSLFKLAFAKPGVQFPLAICGLAENDPIRIVVRSHFPNGSVSDFLTAIKTNYKKTEPIVFVLKYTSNAKVGLLKELFDMPDDRARTAKTDEDVEAKILARQNVFEKLVDEGLIVVNDKNRFLQLTEKHMRIIEFYRNRMNHGVIEFKGIEGNLEIKNLLLQVIDEVENMALK